MVETRIAAGLVVTGAGEEIEDGCVEVDAGTITYVGRRRSEPPAQEDVSAPGMIMLPGLVNTHCHTSQQLARGLADGVDLLTWLRDRIWPYEARLSEADAEVSAQACAVEQIRNGVTTLADPGGQHVDGMARGLRAAGVRGLLGRSTMDVADQVPPELVQPTATTLAAQDELAARWHGAASGRLRMSYTLRTLFNCSDELVTATVERARQRDAVVQMHVAEVPEENEYARSTRGASTIRHLHTLDALGPRFLAVHAVWLDDAEIDLLAYTGTPVSHNPAAAMRVLGAPRITDMLDRGVVVAIGSDGAPVNNRMSIVDELHLASLLQKLLRRDPTALSPRQALEMATTAGARALSWADEIGSLEVGKAADLVLVDPLTANMTPFQDPLSAMVTSMKTENVHSVMCAGTWLLREREITVCDERALLAEAQERAEKLASDLGLRPRVRVPRPGAPHREHTGSD